MAKGRSASGREADFRRLVEAGCDREELKITFHLTAAQLDAYAGFLGVEVVDGRGKNREHEGGGSSALNERNALMRRWKDKLPGMKAALRRELENNI